MIVIIDDKIIQYDGLKIVEINGCSSKIMIIDLLEGTIFTHIDKDKFIYSCSHLSLFINYLFIG